MSPCNFIVLVQRDTDMSLQSVLDPDGAQTRKSRRLKRRVHKNKVGVTKKYRSSLLLPLPILCRETRKSRRLKRRVHKNNVGVTKKYRSSLLLPLPILYRVQTMFDMLTVMTNSARLVGFHGCIDG